MRVVAERSVGTPLPAPEAARRHVGLFDRDQWLGTSADPVPLSLPRAIGAVMGGVPVRHLRWLRRINDLRPSMLAKSDAELRAVIDQARSRLRQKAELGRVLPEVFAAVREATRRATEHSDKPIEQYEVQLLGAMAMVESRVAQISTGQGKSKATIPLAAVLLALECDEDGRGRGVHVATSDPYLARSGAEFLAPIYHRLGLTVAVAAHGQTATENRTAYAADITYATAETLAFHWLEDQEQPDAELVVMRGLNACLVDEADLVQVLNAKNPLRLMAAQPDSPGDTTDGSYVRLAHLLVQNLDPAVHLSSTDEQGTERVGLTDAGWEEVEHRLASAAELELWGQPEQTALSLESSLVNAVLQAVSANHDLKRDQHYLIRNAGTPEARIELIHDSTGHPLPTSSWANGLMDAVRQKEGVPLAEESVFLGSITFQNFFHMYRRLGSCTGTAEAVKEEFSNVYGQKLSTIPRHEPSRAVLLDPAWTLNSADGEAKVLANAIARSREGRCSFILNRTDADSERISARLADPLLAIASVAVSGPSILEWTLERVKDGSRLRTELPTDTETRARKVRNALAADPAATKLLVEMLERKGVPARALLEAGATEHEVLNAKTQEMEPIVARAGLSGHVTSATKVFGRGVDVTLGPGVSAQGGAYLVGVGLFDLIAEQQAFGRVGRDRDRGTAEFIVNPDDPLLVEHLSSHRLNALVHDRRGRPTAASKRLADGRPLTWLQARKWNRTLKDAQENEYNRQYNQRMANKKFDAVVQEQWRVVCALRQSIREELPLERLLECYTDWVDRALTDLVREADRPATWDSDQIDRFLSSARDRTIPRDQVLGLVRPVGSLEIEDGSLTVADARTLLVAHARAMMETALDTSDAQGAPRKDVLATIRKNLLNSLNGLWREHLEGLDRYVRSAQLGAYAQQRPEDLFRSSCTEGFLQMLADAEERSIDTSFRWGALVLSRFPSGKPRVRSDIPAR